MELLERILDKSARRVRIVGLALLIFITILLIWHRSAVTRLQDADELVSKSGLQLEVSLGYGGLIHDFKNALLRPTETQYPEGIRRNSRLAVANIERLEATAKKFGVNQRLDRSRDMIRHYSGALETVLGMSEHGIGAREIDKVVRYDDRPALQEIRDFEALVGAEIAQRLNTIRWTTSAFAFVGAFSGILAMALLWKRDVAFKERYIRRHLQAHQASLKEKNAALRDEIEKVERRAVQANLVTRARTIEISDNAKIIILDPTNTKQVESLAGEIVAAASYLKWTVNALYENEDEAFNMSPLTDEASVQKKNDSPV